MSANDKPPLVPVGWAALAKLTPARIALGRSGASLPTSEVLRFGLAHAQARDAVHIPFRGEAIEAEIRALGLDTIQVASAAAARDVYLRRPDLGRRLSEASKAALTGRAGACDLAPDLALVVADGLSSTAVHTYGSRFIAALLPLLRRQGLTLAPVIVAAQARVALADEVAEILGARAAVILIGERPGLSSPDSLGAYLTFAPRLGLTDAARNCISNIRQGGLSLDQAAFKLAWLIAEAFRRSLSGVDLKDESDLALEAPNPVARLPQQD